MYRTYCVLALVALCAGLAHSFSWEIVTGFCNRLEFIDINGTLIHAENMTSDTIFYAAYDPVHNRVLFSDSNNIYSFDIATNKREYLIRDTKKYVNSLAYEPATELLFWTESYDDLYSISLKSELNNTKVNEKYLISSEGSISCSAVDSCGGFIYWTTFSAIKRARFNSSETEVVIYNLEDVTTFFIDQLSQKMYWADRTYSIKTADLNGKNIRTILTLTHRIAFMTVSNDFIYFRSYKNGSNIWQIPKNSPRGIDTCMKPKLFTVRDELFMVMAVNYNIEDIIWENQNCDTLKSLLPNNGNKSVSTDVSLLCVHGTRVSGESRCECSQGYSGERCDVSVCHNYCLHGDCSARADGQPKCRCNPGYSGKRCEVNACQGYCLNDGVCSLSEESKPLCRCTGHYEGGRCDVPVLQTKCFQAISLLKDILNTTVTSDKGAESSCASTVTAV